MILKGDISVLLTYRTHNAPAANIRHRDAEYMIRNSVAFYAPHRLVVEIESIEIARSDLRFEPSRNGIPTKSAGWCRSAAAMRTSERSACSNARLALFWPGKACERLWSCPWISALRLARSQLHFTIALTSWLLLRLAMQGIGKQVVRRGIILTGYLARPNCQAHADLCCCFAAKKGAKCLISGWKVENSVRKVRTAERRRIMSFVL